MGMEHGQSLVSFIDKGMEEATAGLAELACRGAQTACSQVATHFVTMLGSGFGGSGVSGAAPQLLPLLLCLGLQAGQVCYQCL
jgi:hypothetical protein